MPPKVYQIVQVPRRRERQESCRARSAGSAGAIEPAREARFRNVGRRSGHVSLRQPTLMLVSQEEYGGIVQILRRRTFADASCRVVLRAVAGAEPAAEVALIIAGRHAAEVRADADIISHSALTSRFSSVAGARPGRLALRASGSGRSATGNGARLGNFLLRAAAHEERLAAPHHGHLLALLDGRKIEFDGGQRQHRSGRIHLVDQRPGESRRAHAARSRGRDVNKVAARRLVRYRGCHGYHL